MSKPSDEFTIPLPLSSEQEEPIRPSGAATSRLAPPGPNPGSATAANREIKGNAAGWDLTSPHPPSWRGRWDQRAPPSAEAGAASNPAPERAPKCVQAPRRAARGGGAVAQTALSSTTDATTPSPRVRLGGFKFGGGRGWSGMDASSCNPRVPLALLCLLGVLWVGGDGESGWTARDGHREERTHRGRPYR